MIQDQIVAYGELPDFSGLERFCSRLSARLASESRLDAFKQICKRAGEIPCADPEKWLLLGQLSEIAAQSSAAPRQILLHALIAGVNEDWAGVLWDLVLIVQDQDSPSWWDELSGRVRRMQIGNSSDGLTPFVTASRLVYTLQAALQRLPGVGAERMQSYENMVRILREDGVRKWNQMEPDPPDSGLDYQEIDRWMELIGELAPEAQQTLARTLDQARAQVKIILEAWGRKDFETARRGLRHLLLWDPDRRRVLMADRAIQSTPAWLEKIYLGPKKGELQAFMTEMELYGRELRNQVGPARWLDLILDAFARLRKGASPADLIAERPELLNEIFWLNDYEARRPAPAAHGTGPPGAGARGAGHGTDRRGQRGALGPEGELLLTKLARHLVAGELRLFGARFPRLPEGERWKSSPERHQADAPGPRRVRSAAVSRGDPDLTLMREVPGISGMLECGYIHLEDGQDLPDDFGRLPLAPSAAACSHGLHEVGISWSRWIPN
jgi:hypothetical protein